MMTVVTDGKPYGTFPGCRSARRHADRQRHKVIMEKGASICMSGPGYSECGVKYTQRLTYDGEYLHAAPWNASATSERADIVERLHQSRPPTPRRSTTS